MSYYDRFKRMNNLYGKSIAEESTNKGRLDFKDMLENKLSPTVYDVELKINNDKISLSEKIALADIGNVSNNDQKTFDEKYIKFAYDEDVTIGSYVTWKDKNWLIVHEEEMSFDIYQSYVMKWCNNMFHYKLKGIVYQLPIVVSNLTLYSDGLAEQVYISTQDGKRNVLISDNELTKSIDINTRIMLTNNTVYRVTHVDDFTQKGVRNLTVIQTTLHSLDDLENNIAYNEDSENIEVPTSTYIEGEDVIYLGSFNEYVVKGNESQVLYDFKVENADFIDVKMENNMCILTCNGSSKYIGEEFKLNLLENENVIDEKIIKVRGFS